MRRVAPIVVALTVGLVAGWVARQPARPVPETVFRLVRGPTRVLEVPDGCADPVSADCADQDGLAMALLGIPEDVPLDPPSTETACRARLELAEALTTARQLDALGRPRPFPPDLPEKYREAAFTRVARQVVETCPELGYELRRVDCSELPCLALFVRTGGGTGKPTSCPAWRDAYGAGGAGSNATLVGPDGQPLSYDLVGPVIPPEVVPPEPEPEPAMDGAGIAWGNAMKRLRQRGQEARDEVMAAYGAREKTEAEQREDTRRHFQTEVDRGDEGAARMLEMLEEQWAAEDAREGAR